MALSAPGGGVNSAASEKIHCLNAATLGMDNARFGHTNQYERGNSRGELAATANAPAFTSSPTRLQRASANPSPRRADITTVLATSNSVESGGFGAAASAHRSHGSVRQRSSV